jgi:hypothetical protein
MRIETQLPRAPLLVAAGEQGIELTIGEDANARATAMSLPQARILLHALGLAVAQIEERRRVEAQAQAELVQRLLDQEVRREANPRAAHRSGEWEPIVLGPRGHPSVVRPLLDEALRGKPYDYGIPSRGGRESLPEEGGGNSST